MVEFIVIANIKSESAGCFSIKLVALAKLINLLEGFIIKVFSYSF